MNPGDIVFDPFAGSGTTLISAHQNGARKWIGAELSLYSIKYIHDRLFKDFSLLRDTDYNILGKPTNYGRIIGSKWNNQVVNIMF